MKIIKIILLTTLSVSCFANYKSTSVGLGLLTEQISTIEKTPGGSTNGFEPIVYIRGQSTFGFFDSFDNVFELGLSMPRSSRDSALTKFNYWANALMQNKFDSFVINYGVGLFYTVLKMDGATQILNNGGEEKAFQTPDTFSTSSNLTLNIGVNYLFDESFFMALDLQALNPEDSLERAFNVLISLNYVADKFGKK